MNTIAASHRRHALITGGGTGIGLATATALFAAGYRVTVAGRRLNVVEATGFGAVEMDVTDAGSIQNALDQAGPVDVFVANAGRAETAPALKMAVEDWQKMLTVNLTSVFLCAQAAIPAMKTAGFGRFITIASTAALKGYRYTAAYAAAKHGVLGLTRCLALELAKTGVTANAICPGYTETPLVENAIENIQQKTGLDRAAALAQLTSGNPQARLVKPDEVAATVCWIASEAAASINGQAIAVDGGETA